MQVLWNLAEARAVSRPMVVSVGNFDGVHRAHRAILAEVYRDAVRRAAAGCAVTFEPHPNRILRPQTAPRLITPLPEKIRWLGTCGLEYLLVLPFTRDLSLLSPLEFVEQVLVRGLRVVAVHEGANFRFGHRHRGDVNELAVLGREFGFELRVEPPLLVAGEAVSSSRIRALVDAGDVVGARRLLGRLFGVRAGIARGRGLGRRQTVPTLNLQQYDELLPRHGVYLTQTHIERPDGGAWFNSITNVGVRPTVTTGGAVTVESHLLSQAGDDAAVSIENELGDQMEIVFLRRLRDEIHFDSMASLADQIQTDIAVARAYFRRLRRLRPVPPVEAG